MGVTGFYARHFSVPKHVIWRWRLSPLRRRFTFAVIAAIKSPFPITDQRLEIDEMSIEHVWSVFFWLWMMPWTTVQLSPKPQMSERRWNTICAVDERPDHHCSDGLVCSNRGASNNSFVNWIFWRRRFAPMRWPAYAGVAVVVVGHTVR